MLLSGLRVQKRVGVLHGAHHIDPRLTLDRGESSVRLYIAIFPDRYPTSGDSVPTALAVFIAYMLARVEYAVARELEVLSVNQKIRFLRLG